MYVHTPLYADAAHGLEVHIGLQPLVCTAAACRRFVLEYKQLPRPSPRTFAGHFMMAEGHGLEADLRCMLESHVPLSRLSRMSERHIYRGRGTPIARRSGEELERGGEPRPPSVAARSLSSARKTDGYVHLPSGTSQVSI